MPTIAELLIIFVNMLFASIFVKMKSLRYILSITIILLLLVGCKKYEEGPLVSLRSAGKRLIGEWDIARYYINGNDSTKEYKEKYGNYIHFVGQDNLEGIYSSYYTTSESLNRGHFEFTDRKYTKLELGKLYHISIRDSTYGFPFGSDTIVIFDIKKLTSYNLNIESRIGNLDLRIELVKKD